MKRAVCSTPGIRLHWPWSLSDPRTAIRFFTEEQEVKKNRLTAGMLSGLTLLSAGGTLRAAAGSPAYQLTYELASDGSAVITGYTGSPVQLVIPSEIDGHPVKKIKSRAFGVSGEDLVNDSGCFCAAETVIVAEGITEIGIDAFSNCKKLTRVLLPQSLQILKDGAFLGCDLLTELTLGDQITRIGNYAVGYACDYEMHIVDGQIMDYVGLPRLIEGFRLYGSKGSYADQFAEMFEIPFGVAGDVNGDGTFSISDAVILKKWLMQDAGAEPADWRAGDLDRNRRLDAADFTLVKRALLGAKVTASDEVLELSAERTAVRLTEQDPVITFHAVTDYTPADGSAETVTVSLFSDDTGELAAEMHSEVPHFWSATVQIPNGKEGSLHYSAVLRCTSPDGKSVRETRSDPVTVTVS